jgi:3-methylcrotonyl-CoA carboxylase alpha subunit
MPGRVIAIHVTAGEQVRRGAPLLVIEAMKMEHVLHAPADGTVDALHIGVGAQVAADAELLSFRADDAG